MSDAPNFLEMSDEDILNMSSPPATEASSEGADTAQGSEADDTIAAAPVGSDTIEGGDANDTIEAGAGDDTIEGGNGDDTVAGSDEVDTLKGGEGADTIAGAAADDKAGKDAKAAEKSADKIADKGKEGGEPSGSEAKPTAAMHAEFYEKVMAPFVANGKTIKLKNVDEAIQLMQMGANYTRKMQDIAPHRKVLTMLQNNGLLDEGKLSFLIDLDKKNPEAVKKLVKDSGIDPMEIDTSVEPNYRAGDHRVTDDEVNFKTVLDEVTSTPTGAETVKVINDTWDPTSKEALWKSPEIVAVIHSQREDGTYAKIVEEMDRQRTLGQILPNVPFLQAYKQVGDQLYGAPAGGGTQADKGTPAGAKQEPVVVATRTAEPKAEVKNGDKAAAASTTRTTPRKAQPLVNPLGMSDEEFLKLEPFKSRV